MTKYRKGCLYSEKVYSFTHFSTTSTTTTTKTTKITTTSTTKTSPGFEQYFFLLFRDNLNLNSNSLSFWPKSDLILFWTYLLKSLITVFFLTFYQCLFWQNLNLGFWYYGFNWYGLNWYSLNWYSLNWYDPESFDWMSNYDLEREICYEINLSWKGTSYGLWNLIII